MFRKPDFQKAFESVFRSRIKWSISKRKHHPKVKGTTLRHSRVLRGIERIANCSGRCERETAAVFEFDRTPSCRGRVSVMDLSGTSPLFLSILKTVSPERRRTVLLREIGFAYLVLITFLLIGKYLLRFLSLEQQAVSIAGGIVLFLISLRMIFPWRRRARRTFPRRGAVRRPSRDTAPRRAIDTRDGAPATVSGAGLYRAFDNRTHNCMGCEWRDPAVINLFLSSVEGAWADRHDESQTTSGSTKPLGWARRRVQARIGDGEGMGRGAVPTPCGSRLRTILVPRD